MTRCTVCCYQIWLHDDGCWYAWQYPREQKINGWTHSPCHPDDHVADSILHDLVQVIHS